VTRQSKAPTGCVSADIKKLPVDVLLKELATPQAFRLRQNALVCQPDLLPSKLGFGGGEARMIPTNEILRTLALIDASGACSITGPKAP
jgi:hypothetical protein